MLSLGVKDSSGRTDDWDRYVEFYSGYSGYLTYQVPDSIAPASVSRVVVLVNYRGPVKSAQTWTFSLHNWRTGPWTIVGTNELAPDWGPWTMLTFNAPFTASDYVSSGRTIQLRIEGERADDNTTLDYVAVRLTSS